MEYLWSLQLLSDHLQVLFELATTYFATLVAEVIPKERRGEGMGYFGVGETVAVSVGPLTA